MPTTDAPTPDQLADLRFMRDEETRLLREMALRSTWILATEVLWPDLATKHYHEPLHRPMCDRLDAMPRFGKTCIVLPRKHRKCVTPETLVNMADGRLVEAKDLKVGDRVSSFNESTWRCEPASVAALADNGVVPCVEVVFKSGRTVRVTNNHPMLTMWGWVDAESLEVGDKVVVASGHELIKSDLTVDEAHLLGYLVGDGGTSTSSPRFSSVCKPVISHFTEVAESLGMSVRKVPGDNCDYSMCGASWFIRKHGLHKKLAVKKHIPVSVMVAPREVALAFLASWYDCDGGVGSGKRSSEMRFYTSSERLARDGVCLLTRLGYAPSVGYRWKTRSFTVCLRDAQDIRKFVCEAPIRSGKLPSRELTSTKNTHLRRLPRGWYKSVLPEHAGLDAKGISVNWVYETSFNKAAKIAYHYPQVWKYMEVLWDSVIEVRRVGDLGTLSIQVEPNNTIILNGLVTHNTMLLNVARCIRLILADPNIRIMLISAIQRTAADMCGLIKQQFQSNVGLKRVFPEFHVADKLFGKADEFTHPLRTVTSYLDPTFYATYLGAPIISRRADVLVLDDPVDEDKVATPDLARKTLSDFNQTVPVIEETSDYGHRIILGTPKSYNDIIAAVEGKLPGAEDEDETSKRLLSDWVVIHRHALENDKGEPDINGTPILPNVHTRDTLMANLEECKRNPVQGEAYFWREMMTVVEIPGEEKFKAEWFDTWVPKLPSNIVWSGIAVDKATKDEQVLFKGDYMVYLCGHFDSYGHLYLSDGARSDGWRSKDSYTHLLAMAQRANGVYNIAKEKVGDDSWFGGVKDYFYTHKAPITLYPVSLRGLGRKALRIIDAVQGPAMQRRVHFVGDRERGTGFPVSLHKVLVEELCHLGQWSHDDAADALSVFYHPDIKVQPRNLTTSEWRPMHSFTNPLRGDWRSRDTRGSEYRGMLDESGAIRRDGQLVNRGLLCNIISRASEPK